MIAIFNMIISDYEISLSEYISIRYMYLLLIVIVVCRSTYLCSIWYMVY